MAKLSSSHRAITSMLFGRVLAIFSTPVFITKFAYGLLVLRRVFRGLDIAKLSAEQRRLLLVIYLRAVEMRVQLPNLIQPKTLNDKIQWLKLFDQNPLEISLCDKISAKESVASLVGPSLLIPTLAVWESPREFTKKSWQSLPSHFVLKSSFDSGSVLFVRKTERFMFAKSKIWMWLKARTAPYGIAGGEWPYWNLKARFLAEPDVSHSGQAPTDYKFHCCDGRVVFLQTISGRENSPVEAIFSADGKRMQPQLDENFGFDRVTQSVPMFRQLRRVAERLSRGHKYVRVDLYFLQNEVKFGEYTFHPYEGFYRGEGQSQLGELIHFDTSSRLTPSQASISVLRWALSH